MHSVHGESLPKGLNFLSEMIVQVGFDLSFYVNLHQVQHMKIVYLWLCVLVIAMILRVSLKSKEDCFKSSNILLMSLSEILKSDLTERRRSFIFSSNLFAPTNAKRRAENFSSLST